MKIIYHCYGGAHSSVTAAAIHLGLLDEDHPPNAAELEGLPFYDRMVRSDHGRIYFVGVDAGGDEVYVLGRRFVPQVAERVVRGVAEVYGQDPAGLLLVNVLSSVNVVMKLGGFVSRGMLLPTFGRPVVELGTASAFRTIVSIVHDARRRAAARTVPGGGMTPLGATPRPKIFYHCFGSAHSSIVAAALHLGMLPESRPAEAGEIAALTMYDRVDRHELGTPIFVGRDARGYEVYAVGLAGNKDLLTRTMRSVLDIYGLPEEAMVLRDSLINVGNWTKAGGVLSRRFGLIAVGRPLTLVGMRRNYGHLVDLARRTRAEVWGHTPPTLGGRLDGEAGPGE